MIRKETALRSWDASRDSLANLPHGAMFANRRERARQHYLDGTALVGARARTAARSFPPSSGVNLHTALRSMALQEPVNIPERIEARLGIEYRSNRHDMA